MRYLWLFGFTAMAVVAGIGVHYLDLPLRIGVVVLTTSLVGLIVSAVVIRDE